MGVTLLFAGLAALVLPALRLDQNNKLDSLTATVFIDLSNGLTGLAAPLGFGVLLIAVAVLGFRCGAVPKWWAWISALIGVVMLVPWISWAGMFFGFPIWVLVMAIMMMRAGAKQDATA